MIVHLYTLCWNEADMLPYFFQHYDPWVDRYFIYDDGSDDGSLEILRSHSKVTVRKFERTVPEAFALSQVHLQNHAWHASRGEADWVVITALDEHIFVRGRSMLGYLETLKRQAVTYVPALGFDTISDRLPAGEVRLVDEATRGAPSASFNKLSLFDPAAITSSGFRAGRHTAAPKGRLRRPRTNDLLLYHFKYLGYERTRDRQRAEGDRLGSVDIAKGHGAHYLWDEERFRRNWVEVGSKAVDLKALPMDATKVAARPFWWTPSGRIRMTMDRVRRRLGFTGPSKG